MHVSTLVRRSAALLVVVVAASACSDGPSAPRAAVQNAPYDVSSLRPLDARGGESAAMMGPKGTASTDDNTMDIIIDPNVSRTYAFGLNWIYFPARSICDPATSGYGIGTWDTPCTPLRTPITITVHWSNKGGDGYARFSPELRFEPADARSIARWVILSLHDQRKLHTVDDYTILYDAGGSMGWVNEELTDPTLHAWIDPFTNSVSRRIKHFSGYMLASGYTGGMGGIGDSSY